MFILTNSVFQYTVMKLFEKSQSDPLFGHWKGFAELGAPFKANRAFLWDEIDITKFNQIHGKEFNCDIYIHPGKYLQSISNQHWIYQKDFPLKEMFNHHLLQIKKSGIYDKLVAKYFPPMHNDCTVAAKEVGLMETVFIFVVSLFGLITAFIVFYTEKICMFFGSCQKLLS